MKKIIELTQDNVFKNSCWLLVLQVINVILPMITIPYVTRILGASNYGIFSSAQNIVYYFQVIVEYGFGLWGTREIALLHDYDKAKISKIFSVIMTLRIALATFTFLLLSILCQYFLNSNDLSICLFILFIMVIGNVFDLVWLFQGMQDMKSITIINALSRFISTVCIFIFVNNKESLYIYTFFYSSTFLISSFATIIFAKKKFSIKYNIPSVNSLIYSFRDAWHIFLSSIFIKIFSGLSITILTFLSTSFYVGIYSAISKIPFVLVICFSAISQALYPSVSKQYKISFNKGIEYITKIAVPIVLLFVLLSTIIVVFKNKIIYLFLGFEYVKFSNLISIMLMQTILAIINNFLGVQILVASGYQKLYSKAFESSLIIMIFIYCIIISTFNNKYILYSVCTSCTLSELVLTLFLINKIRVARRQI